jgi:hypothetical protein
MRIVRLFLSGIIATAALSIAPGAEEKVDQWQLLFDGKSLSGWVQRNGTATYCVEDGAIVGKTSEGSANSFLCTIRGYDDFELEFEVKVDPELNSGVQIRSRSVSDFKTFRVHGPQVEIATDHTAGFIYGEALDTGWLSDDRSIEEARTAFKPGEWNHYRVIANGQVIKTWVNGVPVANLTDELSNMRKGFIGLQVHHIAESTGPYEVRWRNLKIRELSSKKKTQP